MTQMRAWLVAAGMSVALGGTLLGAEPVVVPLWEDHPQATAADWADASRARMTVIRPEQPNGTAIVICPGGGYGGLVTGPEGTGIAQWLNKSGITGVVLEYVCPPVGTPSPCGMRSGRFVWFGNGLPSGV